MLKRYFEKKRYEDPEIGVLKRYYGLWIAPITFLGHEAKVRIIGNDYLGPDKKALKVWKNYRSILDELWKSSKKQILAEYENSKYEWFASETEFHSFDVVVFNPKKENGVEIIISYHVDQDNRHYYNACYEDQKLINIKRICY